MIDLKREREARGLSLDEVAERAHIPRRYIVAMEEGDTETLPPGPFLRSYRKQYLVFLDLPPDAITTLDEHIPAEDLHDPSLPIYSTSDASQTFPLTAELSVGKLVVAGFLLCAIVVLGLRVGSVLLNTDEDDNSVPLTGTEEQRVEVRAVDATRVEVYADESWHHQGPLPASESVVVESTLPIEVTVGDLNRVTVWHNGERIDPLHDLSTSRRLVFLPAQIQD